VSRSHLQRLARAGDTLADEELASAVARALRVDSQIIALITDYQALGAGDRHSVCELARILAGRPKTKAP
jgi:hypothetical protein